MKAMSFLRLIITCIALLFCQVFGECRYGWLRYGSSCYYFSDDSRDWVSAAGSCRAHSAELVIIDSQRENDFIEAEVNRLKGRYWLDGTDEFSEGRWEWASTGRPFSYSNWSPGQPSGGSEDCLETADTFNGTWNDRLCSSVLKFICEQDFEDAIIG